MFALGDKVVRKRDLAGLPEDDCDHVNESPTIDVEPGGVYIVTGVVFVGDNELSILLNNEAPHTCDCCDGEAGWNPDGFEKIVPADPAFIMMLNRCKPRVTEDA